MTPSFKAVLARFAGDGTEAFQYCYDIVCQYPNLSEEYGDHCRKLMSKMLKTNEL